MPTISTRNGAVLHRSIKISSVIFIALLAAAWAILISVVGVLIALDRTPTGGMFTITVALIATATNVLVALWIRSDLRRHVSVEVGRAYSGLSRRIGELEEVIDRTAPLPKPLRVVGTAAVAEVTAVPAPLRPEAEVVQMPSPATVAAMRRLAEKVTGLD